MKFDDKDLSFKQEKAPEKLRGKLHIVSTPIGNSDDITERAKIVLKHCDYIICEEAKEASVLLRNLKINKDLKEMNEQNEFEMIPEIISDLEKGKNLALISDCGTPIFADPGFQLLKNALRRTENIEIIVVPGVTSMMTALVRSGFSLNQFLYAGFLDRKPLERQKEITALANEKRTVVLLETPYRLMPVLEAFNEIIPSRRAYIGCNLTMPFESHHYGTFAELYEKFSANRFKGEFVIVFEGNEANRTYTEDDIEVSAKRNSSEERIKRRFLRDDEDDSPRRSRDWYFGGNKEGEGDNKGGRDRHGRFAKDGGRGDREKRDYRRGRSDDRRDDRGSSHFGGDRNRDRRDDRGSSHFGGDRNRDDRRDDRGSNRFGADRDRDDRRDDRGSNRFGGDRDRNDRRDDRGSNRFGGDRDRNDRRDDRSSSRFGGDRDRNDRRDDRGSRKNFDNNTWGKNQADNKFSRNKGGRYMDAENEKSLNSENHSEDTGADKKTTVANKPKFGTANKFDRGGKSKFMGSSKSKGSNTKFTRGSNRGR